eukprot:1951747-Prymnesium_polylepis.1
MASARPRRRATTTTHSAATAATPSAASSSAGWALAQRLPSMGQGHLHDGTCTSSYWHAPSPMLHVPSV